jgi:hypothetical protein
MGIADQPKKIGIGWTNAGAIALETHRSLFYFVL